MKRVLALLLVVAMGVALLGVVGCGGQTDQAKEYLKTADAAYANVQKDSTKLEGILTPMLAGAMGGNYAAVTVQGLQEADAVIKSILEALPVVSEDYQKLDDLSGVEDYQAYSDAMVKTIESDTEAIKGTKVLIDSLMPIAQAGNTAQIGQWFQANSSTITELQGLQTAAEENYSAAQQIKKDKNLSY
jgi:hypothetical protein